MKLDLPKSNRQSSVICRPLSVFCFLTSVFCILSSVSFFSFLSSAVCPLSSVFMQNKPNSPIVQLNVSIFITMNYTIFASLTKVKNKPNSNPIKADFNDKMNARNAITMNYKNFPFYRGKKTNPIQIQFQRISMGLTIIYLNDILNSLSFMRKNVKIAKRIIP